MRAEVQLAEAGAKCWDVLRETEAGLVSVRAISGEAKIIGLTNLGLGLERARDDMGHFSNIELNLTHFLVLCCYIITSSMT